MIIEFNMDRMGAIYATPKSKVWQKKIDAHMRDMKSCGAPQKSGSQGAYFQNGIEDIDPYQELFTNSERRDLEHGWWVRKRLDNWTALHFWGWDAHTLAE